MLNTYGLSEDEARLLNKLESQIQDNYNHNKEKTNFAEGKERLNSMSLAIPDHIKPMQVPLGWPRKACDKLSERMRLKGFYFKDERSELAETVNNHFSNPRTKILLEMAKDASLRHGVSFVFTSKGKTELGEPEVIATVRSAATASAIVDDRSGRVIAALEKLEDGFNLWLPYKVIYVDTTNAEEEQVQVYPTGTPRVRVSIWRNEPTTEHPFGRSRITKPLVGLTMAAVRTLLRQESAEEYHAAPRMALLGAAREHFQDADGKLRSGWDIMTGSVWGLPDVKDPDDPFGDPTRADLKMFPQLSNQPYNDKLRMIVEFVSGETSIAAAELGLTNDSNPASAEAVQAHEGAMIRVAEKQLIFFGHSAVEYAVDVLDVLYPGQNMWQYADLMTPDFENPRTKSPAEISAYVAAQVSAGNFLPGTEATLRELPLSEDAVRAHVRDNTRAQRSAMLAERMGDGVDPVQEELQRESLSIDNFGKAVRAGISFDSAKAQYGLDWAEDSGYLPTTLKTVEEIDAMGEKAVNDLENPPEPAVAPGQTPDEEEPAEETEEDQ